MDIEVKEENIVADNETEHLVKNIKRETIDNGLDNKTEFKEDLWWMERSSKYTACVYDNTKDENFSSEEPPGLCAEGVSSIRSALLPDKSLGNATPECQTTRLKFEENDVAEISSVENNAYLQQPDVGKIKCTTTCLGQEQDVYGCNIYKKILSDKLGLIQQKGKKPHMCDICGKTFTRLQNLKRHNLIHKGKKSHKCDICGKGFTQLAHLKTHNLIHVGKKSHRCDICGKAFTQLPHLKTHNLIHVGKKPHKCDICGKAFTWLQNLKRHNLIHEGKKPHKCSICGKAFSAVAYLITHILIHAGKRPHKCDICGKTFSALAYLKMHILIHEGKKPHKCDICGKAFSRLACLKRHSLIHEGKKAHK